MTHGGFWANTRMLNASTGAVIAVLVIPSVILTVSVLFPNAANERASMRSLSLAPKSCGGRRAHSERHGLGSVGAARRPRSLIADQNA